MKKGLYFSLAMFAWPVAVLAEQAPGTAEAAAFVDTLNRVILYPTIALLSAVALLVFIWGCAEYIMNADNEAARSQGAKHITYGVIGLVVMVSAFTILRVASCTFGLCEQVDCAVDPSASGCEDAFKVPTGGGPGGGNPSGPGGGNLGS